MNAAHLDIPNDALLGDLSRTLAPARVLDACREQLTRVLPERRGAWREARLIEALYSPSAEVRVAYALLADPQTPEERYWPEEQLVYLHAPLRPSRSARGEIMEIDGRGFEAYAFPNDRRLRGVRHFEGKDAAAQVWQSWLNAGGADLRIDAETLQRRLVRYVPEQKWIIRLRAEFQAADKSTCKRRIAIRAAAPHTCELLFHRHRGMQELARGAPFVIPDAVGLSSDGDLLGVEWLRGDELLDALRTAEDSVLADVARVLAAFHALPTAPLGTIPPFDAEGPLRAAQADLSAALPEHREQLAAIVAAAGAREAGAPANPVLLHNDFHWNQLSIKAGRLAILDIDRLALGDPLVDVANFTAQLRMLPLRMPARVSTAQADRWARVFLDQWQRVRGAVCAERLAGHSAAALLVLARGLLRHLRPDWRRLAEECIARAAESLNRQAVSA